MLDGGMNNDQVSKNTNMLSKHEPVGVSDDILSKNPIGSAVDSDTIIVPNFNEVLPASPDGPTEASKKNNLVMITNLINKKNDHYAHSGGRRAKRTKAKRTRRAKKTKAKRTKRTRRMYKTKKYSGGSPSPEDRASRKIQRKIRDYLKHTRSTETCAVCLNKITNPIKFTSACKTGHYFHDNCRIGVHGYSNRCPVCHKQDLSVTPHLAAQSAFQQAVQDLSG